MRILSFDGGGIRGLLSARIIQRIEAECPGFLAKTQVFAGTSVGSFLAVLLAADIDVSEIVDILSNKGDRIFASRGFWDSITHLDELIRADYDNKALKAELGILVGDITLGELSRKVLLPAFLLDNHRDPKYTDKPRAWKMKFMHNWEGGDGDVSAVDAMMRSSAAPTYFPSYQGYIDGGMADNNPCMSALARSIKGGAKLEDISLLSIGTGFNPHYIEGNDHDWGFKQWLSEKRLLNVMFDGMIDPPAYQCKQFLNSRFKRFNPVLPEVIDLADIGKVQQLLDIANSADITGLVAWVESYWSRE